MYEIRMRDETATDFRVWGNLTTIEPVRELIAAYCAYFLSRPPKQNVFVTIDEGTNIPLEHMFNVCTSIKAFHNKYKLIDAVNIYMSDKHIAQCCRFLMNIISPTVPVNILLKPA